MQAYDHSNELYHHGIIGMKWGVRRYQNLDGSLTAAGKRKYGTKTNFEKVQRAKNAADPKKLKAMKARDKANARTEDEIAKYKKKLNRDDSKKSEKSQSQEKNIKDMSDDELRQMINRIKMEKEFASLTPKQMSNGQKFVDTAWNKVIAPAAIDAGKNVLTDYIKKVSKDALGLNEQHGESLDDLKKEVMTLNLKKQKKELNQYFNDEKQKTKSSDKKSSSDSDNTKQETSSSNKDTSKTDSENTESSGKVYTGEVFEEGPKYASSNNSSKKPDDYYEPIDVDFRDVTNNPAYETGKKYVSGLLQLENKPKK